MSRTAKIFIPEIFKNAAKTFSPEWIEAQAPGRAGKNRIPAALIEAFPDASSPRSKPLVLKGGRCIIPYKGIFPLDIGICNGKIRSLGETLPEKDATVVDVAGKYIAPGIVDPHIHLGIYAPFDTEIATETRSALLNGITTAGLYLGGTQPYLKILDEIIPKIRKRACCDIFVHLVILNQRQLEEIPVYYSRYGVSSFKTYMCGIPGLIPQVEDDFLMDLMEQVAALGKDAVLNVHAENHRIVNRETARLRQTDPAPVSLQTWAQSHPGFAEAEAVSRAAYLAKETGVNIYFVHLSAKESLKIARELKQNNGSLFFETTSPYLTLALEENIDFLNKMTPPVRTGEDRRALWDGLADDVLDAVGTDHTPLTVAEKKAGISLWEVVSGYPAVGTHLPSLLDSARKNGFPLLKLIEKITAAPAGIFGIYPQKGTILPGSDADLVIIDPILEKIATPAAAGSRSDFCLHQGKRLKGWPTAVVKAGQMVTGETFELVKESVKGRYLNRSKKEAGKLGQ